ncbi:MAG: prolipoprotein diacylglyceryl transferase, partial [Candidatus Fonsibacter sp.]
VGVILGGRLGYIIFYMPAHYLAHPLDILKVWEGGMSFHGGILGVFLSTFYFCKKQGIHFLNLLDLIVVVAPIGIFLGRIANFINAELVGKVTGSNYGVIFPSVDKFP